MQDGQFSATTKVFQLTEVEASEIKAHLLELRKQYILLLREQQNNERIEIVEREIIDIEHKLAHAEIIPDDIPNREGVDFAAIIRSEAKHLITTLRKKSAKSIHSPWSV